MEVLRIDYTSFGVTDMEKSLAFYPRVEEVCGDDVSEGEGEQRPVHLGQPTGSDRADFTESAYP